MNEQQKKESGFDKNRPDMKSNNKDMKFKWKRDTRNNNLSGTNGMHNSVTLTREHQMQLGEPKGKIREKNPKGNYLNNSQNSPEPSIQNVIGQDNFSSWKNGMCSFVVGNSTKQFSSITFQVLQSALMSDNSSSAIRFEPRRSFRREEISSSL